MNTLDTIAAYGFSERKVHTLTQEDKAFLQNVTHETLAEIKRIQRMHLGSTRLDRYVVRYIQSFLIFDLLTQIHQSLDWSVEYCLQHLRDEHPREIRRLDRWLTGTSSWTVRCIPFEFLNILKPSVSPDVAALLETVMQKKSQRNVMNFDRQAFMHFFRTKILPQKRSLIQVFGLWLARNKLKRKGHGLITTELVQSVLEKIEPGDIIVTRGNWNLTNASIPGFWKHMALYVGDGDVCEAVGVGGIQRVPLEKLLTHNDYCVVLRTRFSDQKKSRAVQYVLSQIGKPYDFAFNYFSDAAAVCSALVTKAYLPETREGEGLKIQLEWQGGGYSYPPNALVKKMSQELGTENEQVFPVIFIDAHERKGEAFVADVETSLDSWKRSRWSFWQK